MMNFHHVVGYMNRLCSELIIYLTQPVSSAIHNFFTSLPKGAAYGPSRCLLPEAFIPSDSRTVAFACIQLSTVVMDRRT